MARIGITIATPGRKSIIRTLHSIAYQKDHIEDVLIVGDGYDKPTAEIVDMFGAPFRYEATQKTRDWGHSQLNHALDRVRGDYVVVQDDDDIFAPRAFDEMVKIIEDLREPSPIIGRTKTPFLGLLWTQPNPNTTLDGHCLVLPNDKKKIGYWTSAYDGDQRYMKTSLEPYDHWVWADRVWSLTRQTWKLWPKKTDGDKDYTRWYFHRSDGEVWSDRPIAWLQLQREGEDDWRVFYGIIPWEIGKDLEVDESREIVEFALWASQGGNLYFEDNPRHQQWIDVLEALKFKLHITGKHHVEYIHEWPPHWWEVS